MSMFSLSMLSWARGLFAQRFVQPCEERKRSRTEARIDAAFSKMADDPDYRRDSIAMTREFETSDWEALGAGCP